MAKKNRLGDLEEIFEILVTSYAQKGGIIPSEGDLCWRPATDAYETEDAFVVQMDLAGMDPTQIEVLCDKNSLLVRGIRQEAVAEGKKHYHKMEISVGPFSRRIPISVETDPGSARARYQAGFLYVTFKKGSGDGGHSRHIDVNR